MTATFLVALAVGAILAAAAAVIQAVAGLHAGSIDPFVVGALGAAGSVLADAIAGERQRG